MDRKSKDRSLKLFNREVEAAQPRLQNRNVAQPRQDTYQKAQILGTSLTNIGIDEFETEFTNGATSAPTTQASPYQVPSNQASTSAPTTQVPSNQAPTDAPTPIEKICTLDKSKKKFTIFHPTAYPTSSNKPKIQKVDREAIKDFRDIAMEFLINTKGRENDEARKEYKTYAEERKAYASFDLFPSVKDFINVAMNTDEKDFVRVLWNNQIRLNATGSARTMMDIISYTFTDFSSNCKQKSSNTNNHERTPFVKYIVPMFKYFSQETNLIEFCWCEKGLVTQDIAVLENNDFVISLSDKKYADGLGKKAMTDNEEFFVGCSCGFEKEKVNHSLDDTLKLLVECSNSLLNTIKQINTMTKKCALRVQVIKQTLTLTKMALSKTGKWKLVEVRSAYAPTSWQLRANWNPLFELLPTIYHELLEQRKLDIQITNEVCGLVKLSSKLVIDYFVNMNA